ncbi:MAG: ABC transporter ATP-binding protein [Chloroflexi bacterium]|nr:ABC transporter ATP-binding protein [Chloroflexota bacterium]
MSFAYERRTPIFGDFTWSVERGESWAIIGPSGCGKTTLLYLLAGLRRPERGQVFVASKPLRGPRRATGLILQDYGLLPWATAAENIDLGLRLRGIDGRERRRRVMEWMTHLGIASLAGRYPAQLSGGQRQRVAIARTLALEPDLLLMDEPFSALDALTREELQGLALELAVGRGLTTVLVTHSIEEAVFLGRRILVLGHPPVSAPDVIENPGAGDSSYRAQPEFHRVVRELRQRIQGTRAVVASKGE